MHPIASALLACVSRTLHADCAAVSDVLRAATALSAREATAAAALRWAVSSTDSYVMFCLSFVWLLVAVVVFVPLWYLRLSFDCVCV